MSASSYVSNSYVAQIFFFFTLHSPVFFALRAVGQQTAEGGGALLGLMKVHSLRILTPALLPSCLLFLGGLGWAVSADLKYFAVVVVEAFLIYLKSGTTSHQGLCNIQNEAEPDTLYRVCCRLAISEDNSGRRSDPLGSFYCDEFCHI